MKRSLHRRHRREDPRKGPANSQETFVMSEVVRRYYDEAAETGWERLVRDPYHTLELLVTMHFLAKYLPKNGLVLDAGGGPGRYTIELAKKGYEVVLHDLSPRCLEIAAREIEKAGVRTRVKDIVEGSITQLSEFADESFDAVLCLGALSHLIERRERERAARELIRVTRKRAPIFVSIIGLDGVFRTVLQQSPHELLDPSHMGMLSQGIHRASRHEADAAQTFPDAYFFHPTELRDLFETNGVETLEMATCEGLSSHLQEETNALFEDERKWKAWLETILRTCNDPYLLGLGEHFLYIGRKV